MLQNGAGKGHPRRGVPRGALGQTSTRRAASVARPSSLAAIKTARYVSANVHVPCNPVANFQGRNSNLADLYRQMIGNLHKVGVNRVGIVEMSGVGSGRVVEFLELQW